MKVHNLKTFPKFFKAMVSGAKTFEVRFNDRDFKVNDIVILWAWDGSRYTSEGKAYRVTYILDQSFPGVVTGFVVLALKPLESCPDA